MNKKEYIQSLARLIKNRVIFHAPICDRVPDFQLLDVVGINSKLPVFKFSKPMTKVLCKAFVKAQKEVDFNLVLTDEKFIKKSWARHIKNLYFLDGTDSPPSLLEAVNMLNINYLTHSSFLQELNCQYLKINGKAIDLSFEQFFLHKKAESGGIIYSIKEFLLNGKNFLLSFSNPHLEKHDISFEINIPLPNGYYNFSRVKTGIKITNLTSLDVGYFNFDAREGKLKFSCIDGLENSTRACINLRINLCLCPREQKRFYFNFGDKAYLFKNVCEADEFFKLSQEKAFEIFDVKIFSRDHQLDEKLNNILPNKIWLAWSNFGVDEQAEEEYLSIKSSVAKRIEKGYLLKEDIKGLKQVKVFSNGAFRHVYIVQGQQRFIMADKTKYFNFSLVSNDFFKQTSEIYLCFGR